MVESKHQPHDQRQADPAAGALAIAAPALVRQDGDEDQIVDAEHHLHDDQGHERGPGGWVGDELGNLVHRSREQRGRRAMLLT
jgi:hypothetical protein